MAGFSIILITFLFVIIPIIIYGVVCFLIRLTVFVVKLVSSWLFFTKCKEQGWKALIPFYNDYTLIKMSGLNWWWVIPIWIYRIAVVVSSAVILIATYYDNDSEVIDLICASIILLSTTTYAFIGIIMLLSKANAYYNICKKTDLNPLISVLFTFPYSRYIMYFIFFFNKNIVFKDELEVSNNGVFK